MSDCAPTMRGMRNPHNTASRILSLIVAPLIFVSCVQAQTGDWQAVKNLPSGIPVTVKAKRRQHCIFQYATDDKLVCTARRRSRHLTFAFPRAEVRQVRTPPGPGWEKGGLVGAEIGAATVATAVTFNCASKQFECAAPAIVIPLSGVAGAGAGWIVGSIASGLHDVFRRGTVIYKR